MKKYPNAHAFQFADGSWGISLSAYGNSHPLPVSFKSQEAAEKYAARARELEA